MEQMAAKTAALEAELQSKNTEINNLDASVKEQQKSIANLTAQVKEQKPRTMQSVMAEVFEAKKEEVNNFVKTAADKASMSFEVKLDSNITGAAQFVGIAEPGVSSVQCLPCKSPGRELPRN